MTREFSYRPLRFECVRCRVEPTAIAPAITSDGEFLAIWTCACCHKLIMTTIPMEKMIADIPAPLEQKCLPAPQPKVTELDRKWLEAMHVSLRDL